MKWLLDVLDAALPDKTGEQRDELARAIIEAIPKDVVATAIADSCQASLKFRAIADGAGDLSRLIANNAATAVLALLQVDDICEVCDGDGYVEHDADGNEARCGACAEVRP